MATVGVGSSRFSGPAELAHGYGSGSSFERAVAVVLMAVIFSQTTGCASSSSHLNQRPSMDEASRISDEASRISEGFYKTNGREASVRLIAIDNRPESGIVVVPPGRHTVEVFTTWSNGWTEQHELTVDAAAGREHQILVYELNAGQDAATAEFRSIPSEKTSVNWAKGLGAAAAGGAILPALFYLAPIWVPIWLIYEVSKRPPEGGLSPTTPVGRPFEGCCFVWIEDPGTGEIAAGTRPSGGSRRMTVR